MEEYKELLIKTFVHECDNNELMINIRRNILNNKYNDEYLQNIINGTQDFINKIINITSNNYFGYISIPLKSEPYIESIYLTDGCQVDEIVKDSNNNFYSIRIFKKIFGDAFKIISNKIGLVDDIVEEDGIFIVGFIPLYCLHIQCKKEIIDNVKNEFYKDIKIKKYENF